MTVGNHNFVKFTVIKPNCQKHSGCVYASGKNAMYPMVCSGGRYKNGLSTLCPSTV